MVAVAVAMAELAVGFAATGQVVGTGVAVVSRSSEVPTQVDGA